MTPDDAQLARLPELSLLFCERDATVTLIPRTGRPRRVPLVLTYDDFARRLLPLVTAEGEPPEPPAPF
jgi:hypothetical protein